MILGLTGRARAGKSTVADAILEHCDRSGISCGLADIGGEVLRHCLERGLVPEGASKLDCRPILVAEGRKQRGWIDRAVARHAGKSVCIIPNLRYLDEIAYLRAHHGVLVSITRLNPDGSPYISLNADPNDPSETELLHHPADFYLVNTDHWVLRRQAVTLFEYLRDAKA